MRSPLIPSLVGSLVLVACVGDDPSPAPAGGAGENTATIPGGNASNDASTAPPTTPPTTSTCVDTRTDPANCGKCGHSCLGGACSNGTCEAYTVTPSQARTGRLVVSGDRLYWSRGVSGTSTGGLFSARLDGTDLVTIYDASATGGGCYALTTVTDKAYFVCANAGKDEIRQCTIPCPAGSSTVTKGPVDVVSALAADPATGTLYYAVPTPYDKPPSGGIFDLAGNRVGAVNQASPIDLVIANGSIFWLNGGTYAIDVPQKNGGVKRASLASPATEIAVVGTGGVYYDNSTLAVDANNVYFSGRDIDQNDVDVVFANELASGASPTVFGNGVGYSVASDGTNVFFDDPATSSIRYCSRTGGCGSGALSLSKNEPSISTMTFDADSVIWARFDGQIRRIAKP